MHSQADPTISFHLPDVKNYPDYPGLIKQIPAYLFTSLTHARDRGAVSSDSSHFQQILLDIKETLPLNGVNM